MKVKIKKLRENAMYPTMGSIHAGAWDVYASTVQVTEDYIEYGIGMAFKIPEGWRLDAVPRSSLSKTDYVLANSYGVIDPDYIGEVKFRFKYIGIGNPHVLPYNIGDRIGQVFLSEVHDILWEKVTELPDTQRGDGGFGSTGK